MKKVFFTVPILLAALVSCNREPASVAVTGVDLSVRSLVLLTGEEETVSARIRPQNAGNTLLSWASSNEAVATVEGGLVKAHTEGTASISVTTDDGGFQDRLLVSVLGRHVSGVSLSPEGPLTLVKGTTQQFTATLVPEVVDNPALSWSSSAPEVLSIDREGLATALAGGSATVTVTSADGNKQASAEVSVIVPVTGVALSENELSLVVNNEFSGLYAIITPEDATNRKVTWTVSDPELLSLTEKADGRVSLVGKYEADGWVAVQTEDGAFSAICNVYVRDIHAQSVSIEGGDFTMDTGSTRQLKALVLPEDAVNSSVTWSSSNPAVATVSETGLVSGVKAGTATLTVTTVDGGFTDSVTVTVKDVPVVSVSIAQGAQASLVRDQTLQLTAVINPDNATNKTVSWTSSVPAVASVSAEGVVKGLSAGTTTVTVTTADGGHSASITISVTIPSVDIGGGGDFGEDDYGEYK